ncbi:MAG: deoxyribonuclease IV, partial [Epsilonproteobacteria bacterium]|nr:deoxyribonuclease IV [Campylobacterota bacterium]
MKKFVGAHVSAAGGVENAPLNAKKIGAKAFALFTKNQRQWRAKPLSQKNIEEFKKNLEIAQIKPKHVLPHDSYLINLGHYQDDKWQQSFDAFVDEIKRVEELGLDKLNFHPGSHLQKFSKKDPNFNHLTQEAEKVCLEKIAYTLNRAIEATKDSNVILVIENTAGQGTNLGYKFEHLAFLIERVENKNRIGVCIDTCHAFSAGYDLRTKEKYEESMKLFDEIVGFKYLKGMHLNDSKPKLGARVDRHANLGFGELGIDPFKFIMNDPRMDDIPLILETVDESLWEDEIKMLYSF